MTNLSSLSQAQESEEETKITLALLTAIEQNSRVTQRSAAKQLGIALGLANAYLKRCIKKGLVKVQQIPANRYAYYLTPRGFAEKSRLTARYLSISFNFFRSARHQLIELMEQCAMHGWKRIAFFGASELAEIGAICALNASVEVVGVIDAQVNAAIFAGVPVFRDIGHVPAVDAIIITDLLAPQAAYDGLTSVPTFARILAPGLLNISQP